MKQVRQTIFFHRFTKARSDITSLLLIVYLNWNNNHHVLEQITCLKAKSSRTINFMVGNI